MAQKEEYVSESGSEFTEYWTDWFLGTKGNEYFCDIDVEYITDKFNLTGLYSEVDSVSRAIEVITDNLDSQTLNPDQADQLEYNARLLYGLVHARYIITARGLKKMHDKYKRADFGYCPRVNCRLQHLLPIGLSDSTNVSAVKLYCPKCEDIYNTKSSRHAQIDGAFFGTSFAGMFLQAYPNIIPPHPTERYIPKVFGFGLHDYAKLARWQELQRLQTEAELNESGIKTQGVPNGYGASGDDISQIDEEKQ